MTKVTILEPVARLRVNLDISNCEGELGNSDGKLLRKNKGLIS
jgi:hypothetical protein